VRGRPVVELLRPDEDDYFVLKPKHSGFFSTTLDTLLEYLGARAVVLAGMAAKICVLFTANDAYMRDLHLAVPSDCVASNTEEENRYALDQMRKVLKEVQTGKFARQWIEENATGRKGYQKLLKNDIDHQIEKVGEALRARMPWLNEKRA